MTISKIKLRSKKELYIIERIRKYLWRQTMQDYIHQGNFYKFSQWLSKLRYVK